MKVTTDACLFGAWTAGEVESEMLKVKSVLDIGTGTGLLSLMLAQKNPGARIVAIEIDKDATAQARDNFDASPWKDRVAVIDGDVTHHTFPGKFDLLISNPPFYEKELRSGTERKNIAYHSDNLTLQDLLQVIKTNLRADGGFFLLLPYKRNDEIKRLFKEHQLHISKLLLVRQSVKHDYFRIFLKGNLNALQNETEFNEMSIWNENEQYTNAFVRLLKDYYLYL